MPCIACREALYSRAIIAVYIVIALSPLVIALLALDSSVTLDDSSGYEVEEPDVDLVGLSVVVGGENPINETVLSRGALIDARDSLAFVAVLIFMGAASVTAFLVARPLERGYIVFDARVKGGIHRALIERMAVSLGASAAVLAIASVPIGAMIYIKGVEGSLAQAIAKTLAWLLALALMAVPAASLLSLLFRSVSSVLMVSSLIALLSLMVAANWPLSVLETYGLVWDFGDEATYDPALYAAIVVASLAGSYLLSVRVEA